MEKVLIIPRNDGMAVSAGGKVYIVEMSAEQMLDMALCISWNRNCTIGLPFTMAGRYLNLRIYPSKKLRRRTS